MGCKVLTLEKVGEFRQGNIGERCPKTFLDFFRIYEKLHQSILFYKSTYFLSLNRGTIYELIKGTPDAIGY